MQDIVVTPSNKNLIKTYNILLQWCEEDPRSVLKNQIHSCRGKHKRQRSLFNLNKNELKYIQKHGLIPIREDIYSFLLSNLNLTFIPDHPINITKYSCGICCRGCIEDVYKIPSWKKLSEEDIDGITSVCMKWIQQKI
mgnify:CR=1 FL=1